MIRKFKKMDNDERFIKLIIGFAVIGVYSFLSYIIYTTLI